MASTARQARAPDVPCEKEGCDFGLVGSAGGVCEAHHQEVHDEQLIRRRPVYMQRHIQPPQRCLHLLAAALGGAPLTRGEPCQPLRPLPTHRLAVRRRRRQLGVQERAHCRMGLHIRVARVRLHTRPTPVP